MALLKETRSMSTQPLPGIDHVILLMLENRSFDNIFGGYNAFLQSSGLSAQVNGLTGDETNPTWPLSEGGSVQVYQIHDPSEATTPTPDPGESYTDMQGQIYGYHDDLGFKVPNDPNDNPPTMTGFVIDYHNASGVMSYFGGQVVPASWVIGGLGAVSDTWYASAPTQTFANRVMSICATPGVSSDNYTLVNDADYFPILDYSDITNAYGSVSALSIFELFDLQYPNPSVPNWKIYYHDTALSSLVTYVNEQWDSLNPAQTSSVNVCHYDDSDYGTLPDGYATFANDVANNTLPMFALIEPRYYANWSPANLLPNNNHPGIASASRFGIYMKNAGIDSSGPNNNASISVEDGEALLFDVVSTLSLNNAFDNTLLIVTYDEHGGIYDHVPPPTNVPMPFNTPPKSDSLFLFNRLGVRVPAIFVGGGVEPGTVFEPGSGQPYPWFDHTSLIRTLREQFGLVTGPGKTTISQLTPRDGSVSDLTGLITTTTSDARAKRAALWPKLEALRS
jgi:phospholipase C